MSGPHEAAGVAIYTTFAALILKPHDTSDKTRLTEIYLAFHGGCRNGAAMGPHMAPEWGREWRRNGAATKNGHDSASCFERTCAAIRPEWGREWRRNGAGMGPRLARNAHGACLKCPRCMHEYTQIYTVTDMSCQTYLGDCRIGAGCPGKDRGPRDSQKGLIIRAPRDPSGFQKGIERAPRDL